MPDKQRINRRQFLKGLTLTGVGAPWIVSSSALARGSAAPGNRVNLGFLGCGSRGNQLMGPFVRHGCRIVAVCDVDRRKRDRAAKRTGAKAYNDFREVLAREDVDAVVIAAVNQWYALMTVAAAKAGKDIYCEKPMSLTIRGARESVRAVRRYGRVFQHGTQQRSDGRMRFACELVRSGRIGALKTVEVMCEGPAREGWLPGEGVPDYLDWDLWLGPAPWRPFNRRFITGALFGWCWCRDFSGGALTDWGAHHFDIAQWGIGADRTGPVEIIPPDGKDHKHLTFRYANGVELHHVQGGRGGIRFTGTEGVVFTNRGHVSSTPESIVRGRLGAGDVHLYESADHIGNFLHCVRTRRRPVADVETACRSVTVGHLGNLAFLLARPLKWDPRKEQFINDDEANRWVDRPRRAPWRL